MFRATGNKGFHMSFANGLTISVQFGRGNYCANKRAEKNSPFDQQCIDAEVAVWVTAKPKQNVDVSALRKGEFVTSQQPFDMGWQSTNEVAEIIHVVSTFVI
jgi:hypothetical protein